jgi:hypothetical protein
MPMALPKIVAQSEHWPLHKYSCIRRLRKDRDPYVKCTPANALFVSRHIPLASYAALLIQKEANSDPKSFARRYMTIGTGVRVANIVRLAYTLRGQEI